jgi:hypothetical protein
MVHERDSEERSSGVLSRHLAHTLPRNPRYPGGFYDGQAFCMVVVVVVNGLLLDAMG